MTFGSEVDFDEEHKSRLSVLLEDIGILASRFWEGLLGWIFRPNALSRWPVDEPATVQYQKNPTEEKVCFQIPSGLPESHDSASDSSDGLETDDFLEPLSSDDETSSELSPPKAAFLMAHNARVSSSNEDSDAEESDTEENDRTVDPLKKLGPFEGYARKFFGH